VLHLKAYLRVSSRALNRARYEREIGDFRGRRSPFAFCNPLSGNRDVSDGKFSSVRFSFLHIIIYSFMFHVARIAIDMPVQLFHGFRGSRVSSTKLAITCPVPLSPSPSPAWRNKVSPGAGKSKISLQSRDIRISEETRAAQHAERFASPVPPRFNHHENVLMRCFRALFAADSQINLIEIRRGTAERIFPIGGGGGRAIIGLERIRNRFAIHPVNRYEPPFNLSLSLSLSLSLC